MVIFASIPIWEYWHSMTLLFFFGDDMAQSKIAAPAKTINTVVQSTGDAATSVVTDATTISAATPINNVKTLYQLTQASKITGILGKVNTTLKSDTFKLGFALLPAIANPKAALARVKEFNKQGIKNITNYYDKLGGQMAANALENLGLPDTKENNALLDGLLGANRDKPISQMFKDTKDTVKLVIGDSEQTIRDIKNWDAQSISGVVQMINTIAGNDDLATALDLGAEFAMLKTLNDTALDMGLYGVIDVILKDRTDTKLRRNLLLDGLPRASKNGDLGYIELTLKEASLGSVYARCPNILTDILSNFRLGDERKYPNGDDFTLLTGTLDKLASNWQYVEGLKDNTYNLALFSSMNDQAKQTLSLDSNLIGPVTIASSFSTQDTYLAFKACYPFY